MAMMELLQVCSNKLSEGRKVYNSMYTFGDHTYIPSLDDIPQVCQLIIVSEDLPPESLAVQVRKVQIHNDTPGTTIVTERALRTTEPDFKQSLGGTLDVQAAEQVIEEPTKDTSFITSIQDPIVYTKGAQSTIQGLGNNPYAFSSNEQAKQFDSSRIREQFFARKRMFVEQNHHNWQQSTEKMKLLDTLNVETQKKMQSEA